MKKIFTKHAMFLVLFLGLWQQGYSQCTVDAGTISTTDPTTICVDGIGDPINITVVGSTGSGSAWVITDTGNNILGTPPSGPFDLDGAGAGVCLIWYISHDGTLAGNIVGNNISDLTGCFDLTNEITVTRNEPLGGTLAGSPYEFCVGDGIADNIPVGDVTVSSNQGATNQWVVTDDQRNILGLPPTPDVVNFDGAGGGMCYIYNVSYYGTVTGLAMGMNLDNVDGCLSESDNFITVVRNEAIGGTVAGGPYEFCVGDGIADNIPTGDVTVSGNQGATNQWVVTDDQRNILGLPPTPDVVNFDGAGGGMCYIYNVSYYGTVTGLAMGMNLDNVDGCLSESDNFITVVRNEAIGGTVAGGPYEFCVGDGIADNIPVGDVTVSGNQGATNQWVVTDDQRNILGLPPSPDVVNFDGAGGGMCYIYNVSYYGTVTGLAMGMNLDNVDGCLSESDNFITVVRNEPDGGSLSTNDETTICVDGIPDPIEITVEDAEGANAQWIITNDTFMILGKPAGPIFDLDGAGAGTCLIWYMRYDGAVMGDTLGGVLDSISGCFDLSDSIVVTRNEPMGGTLAGGPFEFCIDGEVDNIPTGAVTVSGNVGETSQWVITDDQMNILGLPPSPDVVNFDGAGPGMCYIFNVSYYGAVTGLEMGMNLNDVDGCIDESNFIIVTRNEPMGGALAGGPFEFCIDGEADNIPVGAVTVSGNVGETSQWVITDDQMNILGLPPSPDVVNFDGAGPGMCYIFNVSYYGTVTGLEMGMNLNDVDGCIDESNFIIVTRNEPMGGTLAGGPFEFCIDGEADNIPVGAVTVSGNVGETSQWVITDDQRNILGLPPSPDVVNFNGAGVGMCYIFNVSYYGAISGLEMGSNLDDIEGCVSESDNFIVVVRDAVDGARVSLMNGETIYSNCPGNVVFDVQNTSENIYFDYYYVITNENDVILEWVDASTTSTLDLSAAPAGECHVWGWNSKGTTTPLMGAHISSLEGEDCEELSDNFITVLRTLPDGGSIELASGGTEYEGCAGEIDFDLVFATSTFQNYWFVVTDDNSNILTWFNSNNGGWIDLNGAPPGVCRIYGWNEMDLPEPTVGAHISSLNDPLCGDVSENWVTITRLDCETEECEVSAGNIYTSTANTKNRVVVANRASGTVSIINNDNNSVISTHDMPNNGEPMYVVYNSSNNTYLVGDYKGYVAAFNANDFSHTGSAEAGNGVFHMWISPDNSQLWINNELDKTISVINPTTLENIATVQMPEDLFDLGYKPHDVILMPNNAAAFVTFLGTADNDYVVKYSTTTFEETDRVEVGQDPHVALTSNNDKLYVAAQGTSELYVFNRSDLSLVSQIDIPNAHGLGMNVSGTYLYIGNISEGGNSATYTLDLSNNELLGNPVDAPFSAPHNYAVSGDDKLYITHSGATNNQVSVYDLSPSPVLNTTIEVGNNPFGLAAFSINTTTDVSICVDGEADPIDVIVEGGTGMNSAWVITDTDGNILGLPAAGPFDLDGAGEGTCLIWYLSYDDVSGLEVGLNANAFEGCFALSNPITVTRQSANGGMVSLTDGSDAATFCAGDVIFDVQHTTTATELSYWYIITDNNDNILGFHNTADGPTLDLSGAPAGECHIWGWSYRGESNPVMGENISSLTDGFCEAISENFITITRVTPEAATISTTDDTSICVDGIGDPINVSVDGGTGSNTQWVITNTTGEILGLPAAGPFDLDGAGEGTCLIWHLSFEDVSGAEVGMNANDLEGCFALSNPITVTREVANGGIVSLTDGTSEGTFTAGDVVFDVQHTTTAPNLSYWYIITDNNDNILGFHNTADGPTLDLSGAPAGECHIWGWSYNGESDPVIGENISTLTDGDCESISDNFITITREEATGPTAATISTTDDTSICIDGNPDPINVTVEEGMGENTAWIITNTDGEILGLPAMGPFDLDGAGEGTCLIWHLTFDTVEGVEVGMNANDLTGSFALSNPITITREVANGGMVSLTDGSTEGTFIAGDVVFDVQHATSALNLSYWYIITDNNDNILGFHNSADGPTLDLSGAPAGECHIWGWSYSGESDPVVGENISTLTDGDCEAISDNFITITREEPGAVLAATITTMDETTICVDGNPDPISVTVEGGTGDNSAYIITDIDGSILGLPPMGPFDLDGAGEGICLIWHLSFNTVEGMEVGMNANNLTGEFALSNPITVTRQSANGGIVALTNGLDTATYCVGSAIFDVEHTTTATSLSYWYIITDNNDNILGYHNTSDGPTLDLSAAPAGECHIWGWSYKGEPNPVMGENISSLSDGDCEAISENFITIMRAQGINGGTISTEDSVIACPGDGDDDIVNFATTGSGDSYAYIMTDENDVVMGTAMTTALFNFEGSEPGIVRIYGVGYAGLLQVGNTIQEVGGNGGSCAIISDNFIEIVIQETIDCFSTSTKDETIGNVKVYPNPAVNFITLEYTDLSNDAIVSIIDVQGRRVSTQSLSNADGQVRLDIDNLTRGLYLIQVTSNDELITKRIVLTK